MNIEHEFITGIASDVAGGFAGGFISGAGNTWLGGGSFGGGLMSGLKTGGIGAGVAGLLSGLQGGAEAVKHGGDFWSGEGAKFYNLTSPGTQGVEGTPDNYTDTYLNEFANENFDNATKLMKNISELSASAGPDATFTENGLFEISSGLHQGSTALGYTRFNSFGKGYSVFISKAALASNPRLYLTMGHEFLHVAYNTSGIPLTEDEAHASIYKWQLGQAKKFYTAGSVRSQFRSFSPHHNTEYDKIWKTLIPIKPITSFGW